MLIIYQFGSNFDKTYPNQRKHDIINLFNKNKVYLKLKHGDLYNDVPMVSMVNVLDPNVYSHLT